MKKFLPNPSCTHADRYKRRGVRISQERRDRYVALIKRKMESDLTIPFHFTACGDTFVLGMRFPESPENFEIYVFTIDEWHDFWSEEHLNRSAE